MTTSTLPATLDHASANACLTQLRAALARVSGEVVAVNASAVQHFDTSALAVLLQSRRDALAIGKTLQVTDWPSPLERLAKLYGVYELLT